MRKYDEKGITGVLEDKEMKMVSLEFATARFPIKLLSKFILLNLRNRDRGYIFHYLFEVGALLQKK